MKQLHYAILVLILTAISASPLLAQNITNYASIPDPILLLLREPAVLNDLQLDAKQRSAIEQANESLDGPLFASRNTPREQQGKQVTQWIGETRRRLKSLLTTRQNDRIEQIRIRIRGYQALLDEPVAERLQLTEKQQKGVKDVFETLDKDVKKLQDRAAGGESREPLTQRARELQENAQKRVIALLTNEQRRQFATMVGRSFEVSKLAQVRFKAPDFATTDAWLNSPPLRIEQLRGKVVAVHFWAYG